MALPLTYHFRNARVRLRATLATILGISLVVAVFVLVQALAAGLVQSARNTGDPRNVMIVRKGSTAESSSQVALEQFQIIRYWEQIARDDTGTPLVSADVITLISQPRLDGSGEANVSVRGLTPVGKSLRPQVTLVAGRWFTPGQREVAVSRKMVSKTCAPACTQRHSLHPLALRRFAIHGLRVNVHRAVAFRCFNGLVEAGREPKIRAAARLTLNADASAHQLHELTANREPEPGAPKQARGRYIGLGEGFEDLCLLLQRDADPAIRHVKTQRQFIRHRVFDANYEADLAVVGEFDRVAEQIVEHLSQAQRITVQPWGHVGRNLCLDNETLFIGPRLLQIRNGAEQPGQIEIDPFEIRATGFDL